MSVWVDIEDAAGNKLGSGPITTATGWEYTWRLNQAGTWSFAMPVLDPQCDLVRLGRVARAWTVRDGKMLMLGGGRIEKRQLTVSSGALMLQVEGDDLLRELANRTVGQLTLNSTVMSHPAYAHYVDFEYSHDPTPDPMTLLNDGPIGDTSTHDEMVINTWTYLYLFDPQPFDLLRVLLGSTVNIFNAVLEIGYWNGSDWRTIGDVVDGTAVGTVALAQSGDISWTMPKDWVPESGWGMYAVRIRASSGGTIKLDIADITLVRIVATTDALSPILALVAGEWELDAVLGYTSITANTDLGSDLIGNGDFEVSAGTADDGTSDTFLNWTNSGVNDGGGDKIEVTVLTKAHGSQAAKITRTTAAPYLYQDVDVAEGATYRVKWWTRGDGSQCGRIRIEDRTHTGASIAQYVTALVDGVNGTGWTEMSLDFSVPFGCTSVRVLLVGPAAAGTVYFDLVSVQATVGSGVEMQFAGESILEALNRVAQETGEYFTLSPGGGRKILWLRADQRNSGLRAIALSAGLLSDQALPETALIVDLEETQSRYELATRVYPRNQSLLAATTVLPTGWTLDKTANCLIYDTAETVLGRIDKALDVVVLATSTTPVDYVSNLALRQCYTWLSRHSATDTHPLTGDIPRSYTLKVAKCYRWVIPGYQMRVIYHKWHDRYHAVGIDALFYVLSATVRVDQSGFQTVGLEIGTVPEQPINSDDALLVQEVQAFRVVRARA